MDSSLAHNVYKSNNEQMHRLVGFGLIDIRFQEKMPRDEDSKQTISGPSITIILGVNLQTNKNNTKQNKYVID